MSLVDSTPVFPFFLLHSFGFLSLPPIILLSVFVLSSSCDRLYVDVWGPQVFCRVRSSQIDIGHSPSLIGEALSLAKMN